MSKFFVSWELWQQMTFILALAICVVFIIGFIKLWWTNRYIAKIEIIDAEKRAHAAELESTGLPPPPRKQSDIPFGVRAIQSGIEVDGIWISRPNTPSVDSPPNSAKGKGKYVAQGPISPASTISDPFGSPTSSRGGTGPQTYRPKSSHNPVSSRADALSQLEGKPQDSPAYATYQPRGGKDSSEVSDEAGSPVSPIDRSSYNGIDVRVPIRASPVNRHLNNVRNVSGGKPQPVTGHGVRALSGSLQNPKNGKGYATIPQISPGAGDFSDPFATPSRSPVNTPSADQAHLHSQQGPHVKFAPDEYINSQRYPSDGSSGTSGSSSHRP
ncbi:hypothetical protein CH063_04618 [Colletotrichum higginsianum]|uniref:Uncharacterized protein n=2 Tax=Colletotrichum higginsianum TaxID=80884 RepID=H1UW42_COLHI|nr:hypothetical protein CH63R_11720 [Colletotrichum higginsianum IMI 349063]OBR05017.1 hypothetical protein CH63R_11720 [Colletotrichum higginsianum IMI 349063]TIC93546.1 hypothetical protein CH35J_009420 [Colletotrichum higginsianum]GJC99656.1 hypothetical protein ColKHC_08482 [Colletotrichum higginsianum]CCF32193.1 hypothetical protein CH063_04618 [Colletotrichum higginsianum]